MGPAGSSARACRAPVSVVKSFGGEARPSGIARGPRQLRKLSPQQSWNLLMVVGLDLKGWKYRNSCFETASSSGPSSSSLAFPRISFLIFL